MNLIGTLAGQLKVPNLTFLDYVFWLLLYFAPWLFLPPLFFDIWPISGNTFSALGIASIFIVAVSFLAFGKWILFSKFFGGGGGNGNGNGNGLPWHRLLCTILIIFISFLVYSLLFDMGQQEANLFDKATLWSAVYGSIFGTFSYLMAK